jgi:hypothetical protein
MTLEKKLSFVNGKKWSHVEALNCWTQYHNKYYDKHKGALFEAQIKGTTYQYIQKECETFRRYARQWKYYKGLE